MPTIQTETQHPTKGAWLRTGRTREILFWDGLSNLEARAMRRTQRELIPTPWRAATPMIDVAGWAKVEKLTWGKPIAAEPRRLAVDPDAITAAIDWFANQDFSPDDGERIRREAWR